MNDNDTNAELLRALGGGDSLLPAQPNQGLIGGMACLQALVSSEAPVGARELARRLGQEPTRVNRLLRTLCALGLADQTPERKYRPGPAVHVLSAQSLRGSGLLHAALPRLRPLVDEKLTIALGLVWRARICYLIHSPAGRPVEEGIGARLAYPAAWSSIGLAVLSRLPDKIALELLIGEEPTLAESEKRHELTRSLQLARDQGFAVMRPDAANCSLAVALPGNLPAGIAFAGQIASAQADRLAGRLRAAAQEIALVLAAN